LSDLYLLDANVLIDAHQDFYPIDRIPGFWIWLVKMGNEGRIKIPSEIYDEVAPFNGPLPNWMQQREVRDALVLPERSNIALVQKVLALGYAPDLDDVELEEIGKDPFLVAAALSGEERFVVTREVSKRTQIRAKRRLPDVCETLGVRSITDFQAYKQLNFSLPI
jgi:hypothetical protein